MDPIYSYIIWVLVLDQLPLHPIEEKSKLHIWFLHPAPPCPHEASAGYTSADLGIGDDDFKIVVSQGAIGLARYPSSHNHGSGKHGPGR